MQPNHHAAISNDFSIKNSSCSLTIMQLFPTTFLSKTAHAAIPHPQKQLCSFSIKNSSCSYSPPSVCSYFQRLFYQKQLMQLFPTLGMQLFYQKQLMQPRKKKNGKKITIKLTQPTPHTNNHPPNTPSPHHHHHHLTTTTTYLPTSPHHHHHLLPSTHTHTPCTHTFPLLPLLRTQIFIHLQPSQIILPTWLL
jgi:hypothetical protein